MAQYNRDSAIAIIILAFCVVMFAATFSIEPLKFDSTVGPEFWPRLTIGSLAILSLIYLAQSLRSAVASREEQEPDSAYAASWRRFVNPVICFVLFGLFALTLPYVGMLIGSMAFVFAALSLLGPSGLRFLALHLAIAVISIGGMWLMFTYALGVYLPEGQLLRLL